MTFKQGVLDLVAQGNLYVASRNKSGDGTIKQGITQMRLGR